MPYALSFVFTLLLLSPATVYTQISPALSAPTAAFAAPDTALDCANVEVAFQNLSSANATSFNWFFPGAEPGFSSVINPVVAYTTSGMYTATLVASNASGSDTVSKTIVVQVLGYPQAGFSYVAIGNGAYQFTNLSQNADNYTWYFGDGTPPVSLQNPTHQFNANGLYTVTLVADNFCGMSVLQQVVPVVLTATDHSNGKAKFRIYPNPAADNVFLDGLLMSDGPVRLELYDGQGQVVWTREEAFSPAQRLSVADLPAGIYTLLVRCNNVWQVQRFFKQ